MSFPTADALTAIANNALVACGAAPLGAGPHSARSPITGATLGFMPATDDVDTMAAKAATAFQRWRSAPAPLRGELVRRLGEVQEMIDICDFAVGLSRQLHGLTIASERPGHRLMEQWHPLGPTAVITAFNFPVAVWSWNAALALVCGNPVIWKPSELTPLTALATHALFERATAGMDVPADLNQDQLASAPVVASPL